MLHLNMVKKHNAEKFRQEFLIKWLEYANIVNFNLSYLIEKWCNSKLKHEGFTPGKDINYLGSVIMDANTGILAEQYTKESKQIGKCLEAYTKKYNAGVEFLGVCNARDDGVGDVKVKKWMVKPIGGKPLLWQHAPRLVNVSARVTVKRPTRRLVLMRGNLAELTKQLVVDERKESKAGSRVEVDIESIRDQ